MSRSGYGDGDDFDHWSAIRWAGMLASAKRGKRGQQFFRDVISALDGLPEKRLITEELQVAAWENPLLPWLFADCKRVEDYELWPSQWCDWDAHKMDASLRPSVNSLRWFLPPDQCGVCTLGALGLARGVPMAGLNPEDAERVGEAFNIAEPLAREVVFQNDEAGGVWMPDVHRSRPETPEERWVRMRSWAVSHLSGGGERAPSTDGGDVQRLTPETGQSNAL